MCHSQIPNSQRSLYASSSALSSPPGGSDRGPGSKQGPDGADLSSLLLGNGLEDSLLEAVESLESLNLQGHGGLPPLLPEKRRVAEGLAELDSRSPSLSGFSSPHSGSSLSLITMSSTPDHLRGVSGAWSPGAGGWSLAVRRLHSAAASKRCLCLIIPVSGCSPRFPPGFQNKVEALLFKLTFQKLITFL